jgi:hypothetical protein
LSGAAGQVRKLNPNRHANERKMRSSDICSVELSMNRLTKVWFAVAALATTALLIVAAGKIASLVMRVALAWPQVTTALATITSVTVLLWVFVTGDARRRRMRRSERT